MEGERQTYQLHNILTWRSGAALIGEILRCAQDDSGGGWREILRCGLKCTTPRLVRFARHYATFGYALLVANARKMPRLWLVKGCSG